MPTVIDELVVKLGIDASKFKSDAERTQGDITRVSRSAVQSGKSLEESLGKSQQATQRSLKEGVEVGRQSALQFSKFRLEVAALFTTLATGFGLKSFLRDIANTEASTGRLATNIGMSTGELNAWQEAATRNGGSADATGQSLLGLTQQFQQLALTGQSAVVPYFRALGVSISDADGEMRPMADILLDLSDKFKNMTPQRANAFGAALGLDQGTITLLRQGREAVQQYLTEARKIGVISDEDAQAGIKFQQTLANFEQALRSLGRVIGNDLMPIFEEYINTITTWLSDPNNKEFVAKEVHEDIEKFAAGIKYVIDTVNSWHLTATDLAEYIGGAWVVLMLSGLAPVSAALVTITAAFLALKTIPRFFDPKEWSNNSIFWHLMSKEDQLKYPDSPESRKARGEAEIDPNSISLMHPSTWGGAQLKGAATDERKATVRDKLSQDLGISKDAASGIVAPLNAESNIAGINEKNPTVPGSRGGFGWAQWTGPRRDDFEAYARQRGLDPKSDEANYGFLVEELKSKYPSVLQQLRRGDITPTEAANIVTRQYIVPGVPGQADFESKVQGHISGAEDVSRIDLSKPSGMEGLKKGLPPALIDNSVGHWIFGDAQKAALTNRQVASNSSSTETNITGPITINTQAKDADGMARDVSASLRKYSYVATANTGLA